MNKFQLSILNHANSNMKEKCGIAAADNDRISGENKLWGQGMVAYTAQVHFQFRIIDRKSKFVLRIISSWSFTSISLKFSDCVH